MKTNTKETFRLFWAHVRRYKITGMTVVLSILGAAFVSTLLPVLYKQFFDVLAHANTDQADQLIRILLLLAAGNIVMWVLWRIAEFSNSYFQTSIMRDLYQTCFAYLHGHSVQFFQNNFVGSLVKRVNKFASAFERVADRLCWDLSPLILRVITISVILGMRNIWLGVAVVVWVIIFALMSYVFSQYKLPYDSKRSELGTRVVGQLADSITNEANIKLFAGFARERQRFFELLEQWRKMLRFTWDISSAFFALQGILMIGLEIGLMYLAIRLWQRGLLTIGDFVLIQTYLVTLFTKIMDLGRIIRDFYEQVAEAEEMTEILSTPHAIVDHPKAKKLNVSAAAIDFDRVSFSYNKTRTVIDNLTLSIAPGEHVALVAPSGEGKSTIIRLLLRLYDVSRGKILIDGQRIDRVTQDSLHEAISLVPQDPILFHRTLMENIRYGRPDATDEDVIAAAKQAHCDEFIRQFPEGYETYVGERGVKLSGGERQRVAIARAMLRGAPILILDEATSSLDSESEALIQDALATLMHGKTVISIAHRLSTIMQMDRIVVLRGGKIAEEGTHKALTSKKGGLYQQLWERQAGGFIE